MPELPEVETVVRGLNETVAGRTIVSVRTKAPKTSIVTGKSFGRQSFSHILKDKKIIKVTRRGKNILFKLSGDITLWAHLKMTGRFLYLDSKTPVDKHDLAIFDFDKQSAGYHLRFNDVRRFGRLRLFSNDELWQQPGLAKLGPEPFDISLEEFVRLFHSSSRMVKPALLDQSFMAGIGNIYADESLYFSKIHPRKLTDKISRKKLIQLHLHINKILKKAIKHMGSSVDNYAGVNGKPGTYQKYLKAYGKSGEPCSRCRSKIIREVIGSRSAHYCPRCQQA